MGCSPCCALMSVRHGRGGGCSSELLPSAVNPFLIEVYGRFGGLGGRPFS